MTPFSDILKLLGSDVGYNKKESKGRSRILLRETGEMILWELPFIEFPSFDKLLKAEKLLAERYLLDHPVIKVQLQESTEIPPTELRAIEAWMRAHCTQNGSFDGKLLACGELISLDQESLTWRLPPGIYSMMKSRRFQWLEDFWQEAGFTPAKVIYETKESHSSDFAEFLAENEAKVVEQSREMLLTAPAPEMPPPEANGPPYARRNRGRSKANDANILWSNRRVKELPLMKLSDINMETDWIRAPGYVSDMDIKQNRTGSYRVTFLLAEGKNALNCLIWAKDEKEAEELLGILQGAYVIATAEVGFMTNFGNDYQGKVYCIEKAVPPPKRVDLSEEKRVELHIHSKFSTKDACSNPGDIVRLAASFGHEAIAITDHGAVQGFPEASVVQRDLAKKGKNIKLIYGMEGYLIDDGISIYLDDPCLRGEAPSYLSTLQLNVSGDPREEGMLLEVIAKRVSLQAENTDSAETLHLQLICSDLSEDAELASKQQYEHGRKELSRLADFLQSSVLLFTDEMEQIDMLRHEGFKVRNDEPRIKFNIPLIDLALWAKIENHTVPETPQDQLGVGLKLWQSTGLSQPIELNEKYGQLSDEVLRKKKRRYNHIILLATNELGLYHLYRLVSTSNLEYFYRRPRIPKSLLRYLRGGLITGAACVEGEIFQAVLKAYREANRDKEKAMALLLEEEKLELARSYDYLEIQPLGNNRFLLEKENSGILSKKDLIALNSLVLEWGNHAGRPVCATCDSHFLEEDDALYRQIVMSGIGFDEEETPAPLFFRTTEEMLKEFSYLEPARAKEVVVDNPRAIAARVKADLLPFPDGSFPPQIPEADEFVDRLTRETAMSIYGRDDKLPEGIEARINKELNAIISNGYAVMYHIAHKLVKKSNDDGYVVGSRGSVGSSLVANFCGISEVNPLPPHYICPACHYYEEETSGTFGSGFDLPVKDCPECGQALKRDGQDIPFETFLGFKGNKQPDIDLNFSGEYQATAHEFIESMFGREYTFRAGTIQGFAEKNSESLVHLFAEKSGKQIFKAQASWLAKGIQGIKTSTGQHPGGIVVVPKEREIFDFTPIQYPADKKEGGIITTHFDFNSMHDTILKLDVLGHDDPTMLKMLGDMTGVKIEDIPIPDERVMSLFRTTAAIGIDPEKSTIGSATIGLPEVGTIMAREMIRETNPTRFYDLVQLSGLSHGTGVWLGNAQELIRAGICTINEVIGCRDSIMTRLIYDGLEAEDAFMIMEKVRKGRGLDENQEKLMRDNGVPEWYIDSCKKIQYMFPKAHAAAYSISTQRIAWFKVYHPEAYYCAWFTVRGTEFNAEDNLITPEAIAARRLEQRRNFQQLDKPGQKKFYILELIEEMNSRGIFFLPLDLELSDAHRFTSPSPGQIRPPLDVIPGVSAAIAKQITNAREEGGAFKNWDDLKRRASIGDACIQSLKAHGVLDHIPASAQIDLFDLV